jgi:flagellar assembly factor FliW
MKIETLRFGTLEIGDEALITFKEGLPGFSRLKRFFIVEGAGDDHLFMWLQSADDPRVAFPVIEPQICQPSYKTPLGEKDSATLEIKETKRIKVLCIVTIPENPKDMTANLRAPIVINLENHKALQVISPDNSYPVRHPIFADLQRYVSVKKSDDRLQEERQDGGPAVPPKSFEINPLKETDS